MPKLSRGIILAALASAALVLPGCTTVFHCEGDLDRMPVSWKVATKEVDEDTSEKMIIFRNRGKQVVSFDYTVADVAGVPHVDCEGPNSGLVENLYPGAQVEVKNPWKRYAVWITVGKIVYGKKTPDQIAAIYRPGEKAGGPAQ